MCKFPHIDAEGNDCRNPDVIKGIVAPMPPIPASRPRAPRASFGPVAGGPGAPFDPVQRQQQLAFLQQQRAAVQNANANANVNASTAQAAAPAAASSTPSAVPSQSPTPVTDSDASVTQAASQTLVGSEVDIKAGSAPTAASTSTESDAAAEDKAVNVESAAPKDVAPAESAPAPAAAPSTNDSSSNSNSNASLPAKPVGVLPPVAVGRSASQPGLQRAQANGFHPRQHQHQHQHQAHGPFHPHARRGGANGPHGRGFAPGMNGRSASADGKVRPAGAAGAGGAAAHSTSQQSSPNGAQVAGGKAATQQQQKQQQQQQQQRVPRADEFPALGGMGAALASVAASPSTTGRTAAQVLSEPAPIRAVPPPKAAKAESDDESVTMTSDDESDAVIISCKPSSGAATAPASVPASGVSSPVKRAPVSFARIAGALAGANSASTPSPPAAAAAETAPLAVKA